MAKSRYLITVVSQIDGGVRELYSRTAAEVRAAKHALRRDPAMIDAISAYVSEYVDVDVHGARLRFEVAS